MTETYSRRGRFTQASSLLVAGLAILVAATSVLFSVNAINRQKDCSRAYALANIKAQQARIDRTQQRDDKLEAYVKTLRPILTGKAIPPAQGKEFVHQIQIAVDDYIDKSDELNEARISVDYPSTPCPDVKGVTS